MMPLLTLLLLIIDITPLIIDAIADIAMILILLILHIDIDYYY
jgi:hypothetical protein